MRKLVNFQEHELAKVQNHFTQQGEAGVVSLADEQLYFAILEVRAAGAWTCIYNNLDPNRDVSTRNGNGDLSFAVPWIVNTANFTGVEEISGYYVKGMRTR